MTTEQPTLYTARLALRPFRRDDAPAVHALVSAREIAETTLSIPHPYPGGAAEAWIAEQAPAWAEGRAVQYAITDRTDGTLIGATRLSLVPEHACAELGYWIGLPFWNRGYCTEAACAMLDLAFGPLGLHRVQAHHFVRNPASGRVLEKLGMAREGVSREAVRKWDRFEDLARYAILEDEWDGIEPLVPDGVA